MLSMLEEVVLLAVDEKSGGLRSTREFGTAYALVGAVFFDLALARKIDTDTENVHIIDTTSDGQCHVGPRARPHGRPPGSEDGEELDRGDLPAARRPGRRGARIPDRTGHSAARESKLLWIIDVERFPLVDNNPQQDVRVRLANAILTDAIPQTRDIMLVSIAEPCGLLGYVLSESALALRRPRIQMLCNLETISRTVTDAILGLETTLRQAMTKVV